MSLKQALAALGFTGGTRTDTEWDQWVNSEKEQLAKVMERFGIEWLKLDTAFVLWWQMTENKVKAFFLSTTML